MPAWGEGKRLVMYTDRVSPTDLYVQELVGRSLAETEHRLVIARMQSSLASAAIDARRGDYEPARQAVSQFFTSLRAEIDKGDSSYYTEAQRAGMQPLFAGRDEVITLLARSDPASADRLSDLFVAYRKTMSG